MIRIEVVIDDYELNNMLKSASVDGFVTDKKKAAQLLAQNIIDRYFSVEYFNDDDIEDIVIDAV